MEFEEQRLALEEQHKCKVHGFEFGKEKLRLFVKEPDRYTKMQVMDLCVSSVTQAGKLLVDTCAIVDASNPGFFDESNDELWLGAIMKAGELVKYSLPVTKKK